MYYSTDGGSPSRIILYESLQSFLHIQKHILVSLILEDSVRIQTERGMRCVLHSLCRPALQAYDPLQRRWLVILRSIANEPQNFAHIHFPTLRHVRSSTFSVAKRGYLAQHHTLPLGPWLPVYAPTRRLSQFMRMLSHCLLIWRIDLWFVPAASPFHACHCSQCPSVIELEWQPKIDLQFDSTSHDSMHSTAGQLA